MGETGVQSPSVADISVKSRYKEEKPDQKCTTMKVQKDLLILLSSLVLR